MYPYLGECRSGSHPTQARGQPTHMRAALQAPLYTDACTVAWVGLLLITLIIADLYLVLQSVLPASLHRQLPRRLFKLRAADPPGRSARGFDVARAYTVGHGQNSPTPALDARWEKPLGLLSPTHPLSVRRPPPSGIR